jgi:Kef-type K+ transport system membrane component KefB
MPRAALAWRRLRRKRPRGTLLEDRSLELLYVLLILLVVTRICSEVATRLGQPALVGELVGGILIGVFATVFLEGSPTIANIDSDETIQGILDLAIFFLMLLAGVETRPKDLARASSAAIPIAGAGRVAPLALGYGLGWLWFPESDAKTAQCLFLGVALAITAVPVAVKMLMDLDQLETSIGRVVIAAAVLDDVMSLVLLAALTALIQADETVTMGSMAILVGSVAAFFVIAWLAGRYLLPYVGKLVGKVNLEHADFSVLVVFGLSLSVLAEALGMHFLIGAFTAGVLFTRSAVGERIHGRLQTQVEALTMGFLAPVFFASIGIHLDVSAIVTIPGFLVTLLVAATIGKLVGAALVARLKGFDFEESVAIGAAMNARGAVEIIIAGIALRAGLFEQPEPVPDTIAYLFSAVVLMAIVTTVGSPLLLKWSLSRAGRRK